MQRAQTVILVGSIFLIVLSKQERILSRTYFADVLASALEDSTEETLHALSDMIKDPSSEPYLSVVTAIRNDGYGGNLLQRFNSTLSTLADLSLKYALRLELVVVEWNPPAEMERIRTAVTWPPSLQEVVLITVPPKSDPAVKVREWQYEAKNVGIAHARGRFVLVTNADIIFSEEMIRFFSEGSLREDSLYRCDRHDVAELIPQQFTAEEKLTFCQLHVIRELTSWGLAWFPLPTNPTPQVEGPEKVSQYKEHGQRTNFQGSEITDFEQLHHTAAGDMMLMSREQWHTLRGFPRDSHWESHCDNHTDSYLAAMAAASGLKQVYLKPPLVLYHQEHRRNRGKDQCPPDNWPRFVKAAKAMLSTRRVMPSNQNEWHINTSGLEVVRLFPFYNSLQADRGSQATTRRRHSQAATLRSIIAGVLQTPSRADLMAEIEPAICAGRSHVQEPWRKAALYTIVANRMSAHGHHEASDRCYRNAAASLGYTGPLASAVIDALHSLGVSPYTPGMDTSQYPMREQKLTFLHLLSSAALAAARAGDHDRSRSILQWAEVLSNVRVSW